MIQPTGFHSMCAMTILTAVVAAAEPPQAGLLSPSEASHFIPQASQAPDLDRPDPLADPVWDQSEPLGLLFRLGRPEDPERATTIRMLECNGWLYIAARCRDPQPQTIRADLSEEIWQGDSLEFALTESANEPFPHVMLQLDAAGRHSAWRHLQPYAANNQPLREAVDFDAVRARAGTDGEGWWACIALRLDAARVGRPTFLANVMRNRPADESDFAWMDLWSGTFHYVRRFQPMTVVDRLPPPAPRLRVPTSLAVGLNRLQVDGWQPGSRLLVNGEPVPVEADGTCRVRIARYGPARVQLVGPDGRSAITYLAEVPRPLVVETAQPFQPDLNGPIGVELRLHAAVADPVAVTLEARQGQKVVASLTESLASGTHRMELACQGHEPGEIRVVARATVPAAGEPIPLVAEHWCAMGLDRDHFDRYRPGLGERATLSVYRAALADACNFYHAIQAGDGQYRHYGRRDGELQYDDGSAGMTYAFALVYSADWPENPHRGDPRMLASATAGMEAALAPQTWYEHINHPANRNIQAWLLTYDLLKESVPAEQARYWRDRLMQITQVTIDRWIRPATYKFSSYSLDVGTGTNHWAYHAANVYTAGKVLDRPEWLELGSTMMRRLAGHERDGFFPERRGIPATHYTWLTANALGEYYWQSGDETVRPSLLRCVEFFCRTALPGGPTMVIVHDGRNNEPRAGHFGHFMLSLTPEGRGLARVHALDRIVGPDRPSRQSPEFWFRAAENAVYFQSGEAQPAPDRFEFPFLDGRGLVARQQGFTYGLSAIAIPPTTTTYQTDPQNAIELTHERVGPILSGANSQQQPEAGSFHRKLTDRTVFLPSGGQVERAEAGHVAVLEFDTFRAWVRCEVLSPTAARVTVQLVESQGNEPILYSFFPVARGATDLPAGAEQTELPMREVTIRCSQPVRIEQGFQIVDPYSLRYRVGSKPTRAYAPLTIDRPLVLDITLHEPADSE